jgi:hypothetical protein
MKVGEAAGAPFDQKPTDLIVSGAKAVSFALYADGGPQSGFTLRFDYLNRLLNLRTKVAVIVDGCKAIHSST